MVKTISIRVSGKVQGVFFRAATKEKADELKISGLVRNEPDGSVYIEARADEESLKRFVDWCREGPPRAHVTSCIVNGVEERDYNGFRVDRGY